MTEQLKKITPNNYMKKSLNGAPVKDIPVVVEKWDNGTFWFVRVSENKGNDKHVFTYRCNSKQDLVAGKWYPVIAACYDANGILDDNSSIVFKIDKGNDVLPKTAFNSHSSHSICSDENSFTYYSWGEWLKLPASVVYTGRTGIGFMSDKIKFEEAFSAAVVMAAVVQMKLKKSNFLSK